MVDCVFYNEELEDKRVYWENQLRAKYEVDQKGFLQYRVYSKGKEVYQDNGKLWNIYDLINPKYPTFEIINKVLQLIINSSGCPSIASSQTTNYDEMLLFKAVVVDCIDLDTFEQWQARFKEKMGL